jgi:two-component system response regulator DesR
VQRKSGSAQRRAEPHLTQQDIKVLRLLAQGLTNRQIAESLYLSLHTVKDHTSAIFSKLGAKNRAEAVLIATRRGLT